ncbi:uncharacterized protein TNCT_241701 [Trichonephila clavata]|uniref:Uncharacterized protein n=1 Tax=Trichonephila clavata TaxID=2740835 RepID=A0A8X6FFS4_TRICU|nr:uncharacterized protein TNCT_241701 [Trichonephila clavata]
MAEDNLSITPLLTLEEMNNSQKEMSYITRMRNVIKFQIASNEDYEYFQNTRFYSGIFCRWKNMLTFKDCLSHALTQIVKSHVVVHNLEPFRKWDIIKIDGECFTERQHPVIRRGNVHTRAVEYMGRNLFLVAAFSKLLRLDFMDNRSIYHVSERTLFTGTHLDDMQNNDRDYLDLMHKSTWRRVYDMNFYLFSCVDKDIEAYVREQKKISKPVNVFKRIVNRESGEHFDQFRVLKSIALPYYYVFPHQNEREYNEFKSFDDWLDTRNSFQYIYFSFESSLIIGAKTLNVMSEMLLSETKIK